MTDARAEGLPLGAQVKFQLAKLGLIGLEFSPAVLPFVVPDVPVQEQLLLRPQKENLGLGLMLVTRFIFIADGRQILLGFLIF